MKKWMQVIILSIMMLVLLIIGGSRESTTMKDLPIELIFDYRMDYWNLYDFSESPLPTQEEFERLVEDYIIEICDLLGYEEFWTSVDKDASYINIQVEFVNRSTSNAGYFEALGNKGIKARLMISKSMMENGMNRDGGLAHELTHILTGKSFSISLEEGLCNYIAERVGYSSMVDFYASYGLDVDEQEYIRLYYEGVINKAQMDGTNLAEINQIVDCIGNTNPYPYSVDTWQRSLWYSLSQSFVTWLIDIYGVESVTDLIQQGTDEASYEVFLGKSFDVLKVEWKNWFISMETTATTDDMYEATLKWINSK